MKTVLVTGANGQLGNSIHARISQYPGYNFLFTDIDTLDICDKEAVRKYVLENDVQYVMNCAAYTAVDKAEDNQELCDKLNHVAPGYLAAADTAVDKAEEHEDLCMRINRDAVRNLGEAAHAVGAKVIHVSTDYVFDGTSCRPYLESDATCPVSVYGRTKLAGEQALMEECPDSVIIRTAWLYSEYGNNFMKTVLRLGKERDELRFIFDQVGTPTYAGDLAVAMLAVLERAEAGKFIPGIYHFSDEGVCSWYDFTVKILQIAGMNNRVIPIETKDYPTPASRPHYSVLNKGKIKSTYGLTIPHWETSLAYCMNNKV